MNYKNLFILLSSTLMFIFILFVVVAYVEPVSSYAETENNCTHVGTVLGSTVAVSRCVDPEDGTVVYVNSIGFMVVSE